MRCPNCDDELVPEADFCITCGRQARQPTSAGQATYRLPSAAQDAPPRALPSSAGATHAIQTTWGPAAPAPTSTAAIVSLVFGIVGWFGLPLVGAIIAVVAGHMALRAIQRARPQPGGANLATIGLILGYAHLVLGLVLLIVFQIGL